MAYLQHEGILGQKWGVRHGPPYPLSYGQHSAKQKALNPKSKIDGDSETTSQKKGLTDKQKTAIKIGIAAVGVGLAAYGTYRLAKSGKLNDLVDTGKSVAQKIGAGSSNLSKINTGKSITQIDTKMVESINSELRETSEGNINCTHCATAYALNRLFGKNVSALGYYGVDEISGMVSKDGRPDLNMFSAIFDNVSHSTIDSKLDFTTSVSKSIKPNTTGIIKVNGSKTGLGHVMNWECDAKGAITIVDAQSGKVFGLSNRTLSTIFNNEFLSKIELFDLTNASLSSSAGDILKYMVK